MSKLIVIYALLAILFSALFAGTIAPADAQTTNIKFKGQSADASWYYEQDGVSTSVFVFSTDSVSRQGSTSLTDSAAYVGIYKYKLGDEVCSEYDGQKYCWNQYIPLEEFFGYSTINPTSFLTQGRLDGASLDSNLTGYDYLSNSTKTVKVHINWKGYGDYSSGKNTYNYKSSSYVYKGNYLAIYRQANATGSVSGDIVLNLDTSSGLLFSAKSGSVIVSHH